MALVGTNLDKADLDKIMQRISTKTHNLVHEINAIGGMLDQLADADIEAIYVASGMSAPDAATARAQFGSWKAQLKAYASNYTGGGIVDDKSWEIAKRVIV